jgi:hypothetical protein
MPLARPGTRWWRAGWGSSAASDFGRRAGTRDGLADGTGCSDHSEPVPYTAPFLPSGTDPPRYPATSAEADCQRASRNGVMSASTSWARRLTSIWVAPGSTASCAFGRSWNISTTSGNGMKSGRRTAAGWAPEASAARRSTQGTRGPRPTSWPGARRSAQGRERPRGRRPVPVPLELHRDQLPARGEGLQQRPERQVDGQQASVEQYERPAGTVGLVVELQAVHRCVRHAYRTVRGRGTHREAGPGGPYAASISAAMAG